MRKSGRGLALVLFAIQLGLGVNAIARPALPLPMQQPSASASGSPRSALALLAELEGDAVKRFPGVIASRTDVDRAEGELVQARGAFYDPVSRLGYLESAVGKYENRQLELSVSQGLPVWGMQLSAGYRRGSGVFPIYEGARETGSEGEVRAGLEVPILRNGATDARRARIVQSQVGVEGAQASLSLQEWETRRALRQRFWSWLSAKQHCDIQREVLGLALVRESQLKTSVRAGDLPAIDLADNDRAIAQRRAALAQAERSLQKASLDLALFARDSKGGTRVLPLETPVGDFPAPKAVEAPVLNAALAKVRQEHPEMRRLSLQLEQAETEKELSENQVLPKLDAYAVATRDLGTVTSSISREEVKGGVTFEYPLFNRNASGRLKAARAQVQKSEVNLSFGRDRLELGVRDAAQNIDVSLQRVQWAEEEVALALKLEKAERSRFQLGNSNLFLINLREQSTAEARQRRAQALEAHWRSWADLEFALGTGAG